MRLALCIRYQQKVFRLLWINESRKGIYVGVLGRKADSHVSYHRDGTRHFKRGSEHRIPFSDTPIASHKGPKQLGHFSLPLLTDWFTAETAYAGDEKTETVVLLDERVLYDKDTLALDVWLLDRASESELLDTVARSIVQLPSFHIVAELVLSLQNFPDHKLALTVRSARTRQVDTAQLMRPRVNA
jgi:hypothetical protein